MGEESSLDHDIKDIHIQTEFATDVTETTGNSPDLTLTQCDAITFGKKRKAAVDPLEYTVQKFLTSKARCLLDNLRMLWNRNLTVSMKDHKLKWGCKEPASLLTIWTVGHPYGWVVMVLAQWAAGWTAAQFWNQLRLLVSGRFRGKDSTWT